MEQNTFSGLFFLNKNVHLHVLSTDREMVKKNIYICKILTQSKQWYECNCILPKKGNNLTLTKFLMVFDNSANFGPFILLG